MRIVQINQFSYKAAGNIMMNIHRGLLENGVDSYVAWGRGRKAENEHEFFMDDRYGVLFHGFYTRLTDKAGFASKRATKKLIDWLDGIKPDIVHLHCTHGYYLNTQMMFDYLKKNKVKVVWTLHDCWAFTGHCAYFDGCQCEKWKTGCHHCEQLDTYPKSFVDNSKWNWTKKKEMTENMDLTLVTPCNWLKNVLKDSFLGTHPVEVINNGIDLDVFRHVESDYKSKINALGKYLILGVAGEWTVRKGLKDFVKLSQMLDSEKFQVVLVGLTAKQKAELPAEIIGIERTENVQELVALYSAADVFLNPTYEDNYPTTNLEAVACGTRVLTYRTGGSPESVCEETGAVYEKGDVESLYQWILDDFAKKNRTPLQKSCAERFGKKQMIEKYLKLYEGANRSC